MNEAERTTPLQPLTERMVALDTLRGAALFGVLLVNLEVGFRVSLFQQMLTSHTHAGCLNYVTDLFVAGVFEFKAITLFSFLFGVGISVQMERAMAHSVNATRFLTRRFAVLLPIGLGHMLLIWNGDILTLYAVCGLLLLPFTGLSARWLAALGVALIVLAPYLPFFGALFPAQDSLREHAAIATRVYANGSFAEIMVLRWREAYYFIAPLLLGVLPRTFGLILLGIASWRAGVVKQSAQHRKLLNAVIFYGFGFGLFGCLGSAAAALLGLTVFAGQLITSDWWLYRFRFGPAEWLWRSLTYGRRQSLRRND